MNCINCGYTNSDDVQFCIRCGHPLQGKAPGGGPPIHNFPMQGDVLHTKPPKRRKALAIAICVAAAAIAALVLVLVLSANPVAGRWYGADGAELILLKNGKGMAVSGEPEVRTHFMYAIEYQESGYTEGEVYQKESGESMWFYLYDGVLELDGEYFYRQKQDDSQR